MLCVLSFCHKEVTQLTKLLGWMKELGGCKTHPCLIVSGFLNTAEDNEKIVSSAREVFGTVELISAYYEDNRPWPVNCNLMWQRAARHVQETLKCPWWWNEPDCIPLKAGWLDTIESEYATGGKPFMGSIVNAPFPHLTGNAIYPASVQDYSSLMMIADDMAWDAIDPRSVLPHTHHWSGYFHHWSHEVGKATQYSPNGTAFPTAGMLSIIQMEAVVIHRDKTGSVIDRIRERKKLVLEWGRPSPGPIARPLKPTAYRAGFGPRAKKIKPKIKRTIRRVTVPPVLKSDYKTCIFVRSYRKDFDWLQFCLESIYKFAKGFSEVVICVPECDREELAKFNLTKERIVYSPDMADGYLAQQHDKLLADTSTGCDYILHVDSDSLFTSVFTPENQFIGGKPWIMFTPYDSFKPGDVPWKAITEKAMGEPVENEFMRRFPLLYPRWAYESVRSHIQKVHGVSLTEYIQAQPFRAFSEFNLIGAVLWKYHRDKIHWINTDITTPFTETPNSDKEMWPRVYMKQFWSYSGVTKEARAEMEGILA